MPIQPTTAKLNTADGSPMMALGSTALHLWIAEFKFTHNFIICDQLPETELIFSINIQKKFSLSYAWDMSISSKEGNVHVHAHPIIFYACSAHVHCVKVLDRTRLSS